MAIQTAVNSYSPNVVKWAGVDGDAYDRATQLAGLAENHDLHDHTGSGKNLQIPTGGITDLAVTTAKLAALGVTAAKIANSVITNAKIASGEHFTPWAYSPPAGPFA